MFDPVAADFEENLCKKWEHSDNDARSFIADKLLMNLPHLEMGAQYNFETGKILFQPYVRSVFNSAYYALTRFISVDAGATSDTGGKTTIAFCKGLRVGICQDREPSEILPELTVPEYPQ